ELAGAGVHSDQMAPWRLVAWPSLVAIDTASRVQHHRLKARRRTDSIDAVFVVGHGRAFGLLLDPADRARLLGVHENVSQFWIRRGSSPVVGANAAGTDHGGLGRRSRRPVDVRRVGSGVRNAAALFDEFLA